MYPILFKIGPFSLHSLWLFVTAGFIVGIITFSKIAKRNRLDLSVLIHNSISLIIVTLLISRLVFFIMNLQFYMPTFNVGRLLSFFYIWDKGLSFWGALIGFGIMLTICCLKRGEKIMKWLDVLIFPIGYGIIIANFGQFLDGQGYGIETALPWGVTYESINVKYTVPIHPTQIYSMIYVGLILLHIKRQKKLPFMEKTGNKTLVAITMYSGIRFFAEFLRGDESPEFLGVRLAGILSLVVFFISGYSLLKQKKKTQN